MNYFINLQEFFQIYLEYYLSIKNQWKPLFNYQKIKLSNIFKDQLSKKFNCQKAKKRKGLEIFKIQQKCQEMSINKKKQNIIMAILFQEIIPEVNVYLNIYYKMILLTKRNYDTIEFIKVKRVFNPPKRMKEELSLQKNLICHLKVDRKLWVL
ncbi:unnamed protein product [Paramecium sonneborni]|uniref:Uncharacterized protein n=1 Tax=Paramecium sonneborni TaxID=65129 RepID=A0A8S1M5F3_9CILI|nr:unnamed protein product [Paramecium sonneborni]